MARAKDWLDERVKTQGNQSCPSGIGGKLPTRVIAVGDLSTDPYLYECTSGETGVWAALSYCWGPSTSRRFTTTTVSLAQMKKRFRIKDLPRTCRDAITAARWLHIPYVWIDSLCIVQDSQLDWEKESALMCDVYQNAVVTFAAKDSPTSDTSLFSPSPSRDFIRLGVDLPDGESGDVFARHQSSEDDF